MKLIRFSIDWYYIELYLFSVTRERAWGDNTTALIGFVADQEKIYLMLLWSIEISIPPPLFLAAIILLITINSLT